MEMEIIAKETGVPIETAKLLAELAQRIRQLTNRGLEEGASTRLLLHTARLIHAGIPAISAADSTLVETLSDDSEMQQTLRELVDDFFGN